MGEPSANVPLYKGEGPASLSLLNISGLIAWPSADFGASKITLSVGRNPKVSIINFINLWWSPTGAAKTTWPIFITSGGPG